MADTTPANAPCARLDPSPMLVKNSHMEITTISFALMNVNINIKTAKMKQMKTHLAACSTASWHIHSTDSSTIRTAIACAQASACIAMMWAIRRPYWMARVVASKKKREGIVSSMVSRVESEGGVIRNVSARVLDVRDNNARQYQTMNNEYWQNSQRDSPSECIRGNSLVRSCCRRLVHLSKYRMRQQTTAVDQPPFSAVFNVADNALDGFDVSRVQAPPLLVMRNWRQPMRIGENSLNLPNNGQTDVFSLLRFKFVALGNGDDDDVQKLPEERF